ncbi:Gamma interferon inducible lysosomal thiol reductase GILT [Dillenia turbinata]|uniref:Gamma interferon inducible lysosomal thiol reductase GILT n=1 Tax=Dillenia turbinata TaxID=194707 RepID=A0AAN8VYH7_9MAGN
MASYMLLSLSTHYILLFSLAFPSNCELFSSPSEKVNLTLYYETLCPYCANFIVGKLSTIFNNGIIDITNLRLVPWGNALMYENGSFQCQHGRDECILNIIEGCIVHSYPEPAEEYGFIKCIEDLTRNRTYDKWESCFQTTGSLTPVADCLDSDLALQIAMQNNEETGFLNPPHEYVPWVIVNGTPILEDLENFTYYVCNAYKGNFLPNACESQQTARKTTEEASSIGKVCYAGEKQPSKKIPSTSFDRYSGRHRMKGMEKVL